MLALPLAVLLAARRARCGPCTRTRSSRAMPPPASWASPCSRTGSPSARRVPWAEAGVGAVATQSFVDPSYGPLGLALMKAGRTAPEALAALLAGDSGRDVRQVGMVDAKGSVATHTGKIGHPGGGRPVGRGLRRAGEPDGQADRVARDGEAFEAAKGDLAERMLAALDAARGGGRRHPRPPVRRAASS